MFGATFNLVTRVGFTIIFGTPKNGSLKMNSLPSNNYFSNRNFLENSINALSKMVLKELRFYPKAQILYISDNTILFKFRRHVVVQIRIK